MCERAGPSYQPPRPSRLPEHTPSKIQNRNIMQYQNSASFEELAKPPHGLQRKQETSRLIFADVWQPNRKGWRKYHSSLTAKFFFLNIFGAQSTAPSSLDSSTQLVINSSNFYARFLSFSRETTFLERPRKKKKKKRKKKKKKGEKEKKKIMHTLVNIWKHVLTNDSIYHPYLKMQHVNAKKRVTINIWRSSAE